MSIAPDEAIVAGDFINESEIPTPQSGAVGKVPKLEADGKLSESFLNPFSLTLLGSNLSRFDALSNRVLNLNASEKTTTATTYTKIKETVVNENVDLARITFEARVTTSAGTVEYADAAIYLNGVLVENFPLGTGTTYSTKSVDFVSGFSSGDLIQIYARRLGSANTVYVRNLSICYDSAIETIGGVVLSPTLVCVDPDPVSATSNS